jgi:hypothetical protein
LLIGHRIGVLLLWSYAWAWVRSGRGSRVRALHLRDWRIDSRSWRDGRQRSRRLIRWGARDRRRGGGRRRDDLRAAVDRYDLCAVGRLLSRRGPRRRILRGRLDRLLRLDHRGRRRAVGL